MKNRIEKIVVILFVFAMCLLMSISAHAGNRYFFESGTLPSRIELDGVTIKRTVNCNAVDRARKIFGCQVDYYAKVKSEGGSATEFKINTSREGVLLVYYARSWSDGSTVNDGNDLKIAGKNGFAEYSEMKTSLVDGVKYYVLDTGEYTMTANNLCAVYGFVYLPGQVAAYNTRGKGDVSLIGQCCNSCSNLPVLSEEGWDFGGWYKDEACTEKAMDGDVINSPTVLFARWTKIPTVNVWDLTKNIKRNIDNLKIKYDGLIIHGSNSSVEGTRSDINNVNGLGFMRRGLKQDSEKYDCVEFTPNYDGELSVTYKSANSGAYNRICAIGTDVVAGSDVDVLKKNTDIVACGYADGVNWKTLQAKLKAGTTYYIYMATTGGISISGMKYTASASSADVDGNSVTLTTTANMQGWRAFYDGNNSYTVDENTNVYIAVSVEDGDENDNTQTVKFINKTGKKVPIDCAVVLHSDAVQADGTYLITMTKDANPYEYNVGDNLLRHSEGRTAVNAYRLGYRSGEGNGVAFYSWKADNPSEGIVYLEQPSNSAKIAFEIEDAPTGIASIHNEQDKNNQYFNLNGQRLAAPQKGLNIINGKKCIVR